MRTFLLCNNTREARIWCQQQNNPQATDVMILSATDHGATERLRTIEIQEGDKFVDISEYGRLHTSALGNLIAIRQELHVQERKSGHHLVRV